MMFWNDDSTTQHNMTMPQHEMQQHAQHSMTRRSSKNQDQPVIRSVRVSYHVLASSKGKVDLASSVLRSAYPKPSSYSRDPGSIPRWRPLEYLSEVLAKR